MASLTGQQIDQTYQGLIKTSANTAVSFPPASLEDGAGNTIGIKLGDGTGVGAGLITQIEGNPGVPGDPSVSVDGNGVNIQKVIAIAANGGTASITGGTGGQFDIFDGTFNFGAGFPGAPATTVDFSNATVTGLPSGAAGLESGTGASSMQSAASLTTIGANASGGQTIALGNNARAAGSVGIAIGNNAHAQNNEAMAIGPDAFASGNAGTIAIGRQSNSTAIDSVGVGRFANATGSYSAAFGRSADAQGEQALALGYDATATGDQSVAIGDRANATAQDSVAIGKQVVASTANTVSLKRLQMLDYASLNFASDSAAATGGIPLGGVYHTSGTVKVRIA